MGVTFPSVLLAGVLLCSLGVLTTADDLETNVVFTDCGSGNTTIHYVVLDPCPRELSACKLSRNTTHTMKIGFTAGVEIAHLRHKAMGNVWGRWLPFQGLASNDACTATSPSCPIAAGTKVDYEYSFLVRHNYPKIRVESRWQLIRLSDTDSNEVEDEPEKMQLLCIKIIGKIV